MVVVSRVIQLFFLNIHFKGCHLFLEFGGGYIANIIVFFNIWVKGLKIFSLFIKPIEKPIKSRAFLNTT